MTWHRVLPCMAILAMALTAASSFQSEIGEWRAQREKSLKADGGWLTLTGLFWLREGANPFGKDDSNAIAIEDGPAHAGVFELEHGKVTVTMNGSTRAVKPDPRDVVKSGRLSLLVIERSGKFGIRVKDPESEARREFHGLEYFPASEAYRVTARWVAEPREIGRAHV